MLTIMVQHDLILKRMSEKKTKNLGSQIPILLENTWNIKNYVTKPLFF
jgi:hypothetical protein